MTLFKYFIFLLIVTSNLLAKDYTFSFSHEGKNTDGYILYQLDAIGQQVEISRIQLPENTFRHDANAGERYYVKAFNIAGESGPSNIVVIPDVPNNPDTLIIISIAVTTG